MRPRHRVGPIRTMIVDDHALVRAGYVRLLDFEGDIVVVAEYARADEAYHALQLDADLADVMVLDLSLPGRSGLDLMRRVGLLDISLRVLVCTMHDGAAMVTQALEAGAAGFLTKSSDPALLGAAIRRVAAGETVLSPDVASAAVASAAPHLALSAREFEVLLMLARGDAADRIATTLSLAPKTVANVQTQIRAKLGVATPIELLRYAQQHRLLLDTP